VEWRAVRDSNSRHPVVNAGRRQYLEGTERGALVPRLCLRQVFNVGHSMGQPFLCSCFSRRLIFEGWPSRNPFGRAEKPPIAFICDLEKQIRIGPVLRGRGPVCDIGLR
jgi:hypothetical protein